ncbi:MAG: OmpP1/FadL family transporter [Acidiferrobacteraceae bacterium]
MVRTKRLAVTTALAAVLAALPVAAFATTAGYFELGYSSKNDGLAGAGVALPEDSMAQAVNPAGIAFVGSRVDLGAAAFWAFRGYSTYANGTINNTTAPVPCAYCGSSSDFFIIPHVGVTYALDGSNTVGLAMYGNGGMSTNYKVPSSATTAFFQPGSTGVNFKQLYMQASYAYKFMRHDSVGVGLLYVRQYFSDAGLSTFHGQSTNAAALSNNGVDMGTGFGVRLGTQIRLMRDLNLGLSWTPEIHMSRFASYSGLFADHGNFNIPETWTGGLAFKPLRHQVVAFDVQRIMYGAIPSVGHPGNYMNQCFSSPTEPNSPYCLGGENGPGFGWKDITVYKLGYQIATSRQWTWRAGFAYNTQPVSGNQLMFNTLAPGVIQRDITAGFTRHIAHNQDLTVAAMWGMPQKVYQGPDPSFLQFGKGPSYVYLHEYELNLNWGIKF